MNDRETGAGPAARRGRRPLIVILAILVAVTAAIVGWNLRMKSELRRDVRYIPLNVQLTPEMELLREYIRIDTSTPEGSAKGARWLAALLARNGVRAEVIESAPGRLNVYARVKGRSAGEGLMLFNHIDVVPAEGAWKVPPFEAAVIGDEMHGRGTIDMKAMALCQLFAFVEIARKGEPPPHDLVFLATADEETGSDYGMKWLIANRPDVFKGVRYGLTEGGVTEMSGSQLVYFGIEIGGKQLVEAELGADAPEPLREARIALEPFMYQRVPDRVLPEVSRYFREISPTRFAYREQLADIERTIATGRFWDLPVSYRDLTQNSIFAGAPRRSEDGRWLLNVQMLNLPDELPEERLRWLESIATRFGANVAQVRKQEGPVPFSPVDTPLFTMIAAEGAERFKVPAGTLVNFRSGTDARFLRPLGIVSYGVAPIKVTYYQASSIHGRDERIHLQSYQEGIEFMKSLLRRWSTTQ